MPDTMPILPSSTGWEPHFVIGLPPNYRVERKNGRKKGGPYRLFGPIGFMAEFKEEEDALYPAESDWEGRNQHEGQGVGEDTSDFIP
ncbi:hypothetical protein ACFSOZ_24310 [Mesorhizobium newzealandense]|uniref:Uncharacterized protein n=1 Tax=Mesorhizobium newzealandense TaxID=1300302 RepID=A0ABW4UDF4_9HYPH